jgi:hypothetical protein
MKNKILHLCTLVLLISSTACNPKLSTVINKQYPPLEADAPVKIYTNGKQIPNNSESLASFSITEAKGSSLNCDSVVVFGMAINTARQLGGNALLITRYAPPSRESSCYQIWGEILAVQDIVSNEDSSEIKKISKDLSYRIDTLQYISKKKERNLPSFVLGGNFGWGWRTAELAKGLTPAQTNYFKQLKSGTEWAIFGDYYFNNIWGLGFIYAAYNAKANAFINGDTGETNDRINFAGPVVRIRGAVDKKNMWIFNGGIGIGYAGYKSEDYINDRFLSKITGSTVAVRTMLGLECKFTDYLGVAFDFAYTGGVVTEVTITDNTGRKTKYKTDDYNDGEGLGKASLMLGLRYYIK